MTDAPGLLVVEDEVLLHMVLEDELTAAGFAVVLTTSASGALGEIERHGETFKALITDIRLGPGQNGWELAHRVREKYPAMSVVYMSGDSAQDWPAYGVPKSIMLSKPFAMAQLITAVAQLLNAVDPAISNGPAGTPG